MRALLGDVVGVDLVEGVVAVLSGLRTDQLAEELPALHGIDVAAGLAELSRYAAEALAAKVVGAEELPAGRCPERLTVVSTAVDYSTAAVVTDDAGRVAVWAPSVLSGGHVAVGASIRVVYGTVTHAKRRTVTFVDGTSRELPRVERLRYTVETR